jgi:hypothetical protein
VEDCDGDGDSNGGEYHYGVRAAGDFVRDSGAFNDTDRVDHGGRGK